jgi:hypothetical protein
MRRTVLLALAVGLAIGGIFIGLVVAGAIGGGNSKEPAEKQALETAQARTDATVQAVAHAPKDSNTTPVPTRQSCPIDTSTMKTQVFTGLIHQPPSSPIFDEITLLNEAGAVGSDGVPYSLWFGVSKTDSQQGVIVVWQGVKDPCAEGRTSLDPQKYLVPFKASRSTLTRIDASTVTFQDADGGTGQFNYVNKAFSTAASQ